MLKKNIIITMALALLLNTKANSQQQLSLGINAGSGISTGYGAVVSPDLRYQLQLAHQFSILITAGYINFKPSFVNHEQGFPKYEFIPVKGGAKYFFNGSGAGYYGLAEAGAAFSTQSSGHSFNTGTRGTVLVLSPALGFAWRNRIDLALKYEGYAKDAELWYIGLRLAYGIKL